MDRVGMSGTTESRAESRFLTEDRRGHEKSNAIVNNTETEVSGGVDGVVRKTETGLGRSDVLRGLGKTVLGRQLGQRQAARELTREIEQATGAFEEGEGADKAGLGSAVMGATQGELNQARAELRLDEDEIKNPLRYVGEETPVLATERLDADMEDLRNEENLPPEGASEAERALIERDHKIVKGVSTSIAEEMKGRVESLMKDPVIRPADLVELQFTAMVEALASADGYKFGQGNAT